ncbi:60Kd inner membrane protein-domain-containing protein [Collybia nuda]|uniref:60Kd inner membrane protein-domain-containing protein n=1 Tax=Collybia nuda TaxID=64659 RepID=A0A9P6CAT8_9AGAR|nr:60Kd inner membrane protein-domain-containing protein [Collybia nuda]
MAFAGLSSSIRLNSLRLAGNRLAPQTACYSRLPNVRAFSSVLRHSTRRKGAIQVVVLGVRSYTKPTSQSQAVASSTSVGDTTTPESASSAVGADQVAALVEVPPPDSSSAADILPDFVDTAISHLPPALQYGDLAALGLASWTPAGLIRWSLEIINVATGLPWFWTIVAGSIFWKAILVPLSVQGLRNSARLLPLQPKIKEFQDEMAKLRVSGDKLALQRHALKMRKTYNDAGVNMGMSALIPIVQIPITLGMFFGVKAMCALPVVQMTYSGLSILPDLTVPDPYMVLPILLCAAVNAQISIGAAELNLTERPEMGHIMNGLRLLSGVGIFVMNSFPSGLLVALVTTSFATTLQSLAFQYPPIRKALDIPSVPAHLRGKLPSIKSSFMYVIERWQAKVAEAKAQAKQPRRR